MCGIMEKLRKLLGENSKIRKLISLINDLFGLLNVVLFFLQLLEHTAEYILSHSTVPFQCELLRETSLE
jgi:hypothetical protein